MYYAFTCIALCVLSLTRALLQIHCGFTIILRLGSGQRGGCRFVTWVSFLRLPSLRGVAAFCRYSRVGNLDVRGALIFESSSYVDGLVVWDSGCTSPCFLSRIKHNKVISSVISSVSHQGIPHLVSCLESGILNANQRNHIAVSSSR